MIKKRCKPKIKRKKVMLNKNEIKRRLDAVENAVASQRIEGKEPDPRFIMDLEKVARGEMNVDDLIAKLHRRAKNE